MAQGRSTGRVRDARRRREAIAKLRYFNGYYEDDEGENYGEQYGDADDYFFDQRQQQSKSWTSGVCHNPLPTFHTQNKTRRGLFNVTISLSGVSSSSSSATSATSAMSTKRPLASDTPVDQPTWDSDDELGVPSTATTDCARSSSSSKKKVMKAAKAAKASPSSTGKKIVLPLEEDAVSINAQRLADQDYDVRIIKLSHISSSKIPSSCENVDAAVAHDGSTELDEELAISEDPSTGAWDPTERSDFLGVVASGIAMGKFLAEDPDENVAFLVVSENGGDATIVAAHVAAAVARKSGVDNACLQRQSKQPASAWAKKFTGKLKTWTPKAVLRNSYEFHRDEI